MNINLHIDCDPLWVYSSEYGFTPDYRDGRTYEESLPAMLEMLQARNLRATWFVIGRDLEMPSCREFCRRLLAAGHEIGNHTYSHRKDIHSLSHEALRREITDCHEAIRRELNYTCRGVRLPGYYFDRSIVPIMRELDYLYDSSVLPGPGVHMMKAVYLLFNRSEREKRFGRPWFLFSRVTPHRLTDNAGSRACWEAPIGTAPVVRLPIHSTFVFQWGIRYFDISLALSRILRPQMLYLFHAIDLLDSSKSGQLGDAVATLRRPVGERRVMVSRILDAVAHESVTTTEETIAARK